MPFQPGHPAFGHRPRGAPSRYRWAIEACEAEGVDPFVILARIARDSADEETRLRAAAHLACYIAPKLKAVELRGDGDGDRLVIEVVTDSPLLAERAAAAGRLPERD